jgi:hydroxymethylbilane synthase
MSLNDENSFICTKLERDFVSKIGAGCSAPVAVNAVMNGDEMHIEAMLGYPDGTHIMHKELTAKVSQCDTLGEVLAELMIADGALEILSRAEEIAFKDQMPQRL